MDPLTLGIIGLGALKTGFGLFQSDRQAAEERAATRETGRRMRAQNAQILRGGGARGGGGGGEMGGGARAMGAGGGSGLWGSLPAYLQLMAQEMNRQVEWTRKAGGRRAALGQQAGIFGAATDFGGSLLKAGEMAKWWQGGEMGKLPEIPDGP